MQTTLLGLAIAAILAVLAALVGPYFVDWNKYRPQFEAEASRLIGARVQVGDALDARLLPTPTLRLKAVTIGGAGDASRVRADRLDVEFSLSSLMRGEWRASELTIEGLALDLGLDDRGRVVWPGQSGGSNLGALAIDRLKLNGRIALHDAASQKTFVLDHLAFAGDVRALAGAARGDGEFRFDAVRYPFRLLTSRAPDGVGTRLHFAVDPAERPIGFDLDGVVSFEAMVPHFDGAVTLSRAITLRGGDSRTPAVTTPWKLAAKLKADPAHARFDQLEAVYGSEDVALKLSGSADVGFGAAPSLHAALSAHQLDADRLLARETASGEPTRLIPWLRGLVAVMPRPLLATRIAVAADTITLGGRPMQNIAAELHSEGNDWLVDRIEGRLPGATQLSLTGRLTSPPAPQFAGALKIDAADPDLLSVWLRGESELSARAHKPLRLTGVLSVAAERVALDDVDAEIDAAAVTGRLALAELPAVGAAGGGTRFEAAISGERLDLDGLIALGRTFGGPRDSWPDEATIALDLGHATLAGQEFAPVAVRLGYGADTATLTKLSLGATGGVTIDGSGTLDRLNRTGRLTVGLGAAAMPALTRLVAPLLSEEIAGRLAALPADGAAKATLSLSLDKAAQPDRVNALATAEIISPHLKATLRAASAPAATALRGIDLDALREDEVSLDAKLSADRGTVALQLLGLDRVVAGGDGPLQVEGSARGAWHAPVSFKLALTGATLDADAQGTLTPAADPARAATASIALVARKLDLAPLFDVAPGRLPSVALSSRIAVAAPEMSFDEIDGTVAGTRLRGHLAVTRGHEPAIRGELGMDRLDLGAAFAVAIGASGRSADEPLGRVPWMGAHGSVAVQTPRGLLPGGMEIKPLAGTLRLDGAALSFEGKGGIGGGEIDAEITARGSTEGVALEARAQLANVDGTALSWRGLAMPAGKTALQMTLSGRGRSAGVIVGTLSGGGTLSIEQARIAGLDPAAFDAAVAASDAGKVAGDVALRDLVGTALKGAPLAIGAAQFPFSLRDGGLRLAPTTLAGDGARVVVSGGYDFTADQLDLRADLTAMRIGTGTDHPSIEIFAHGPPDRPIRTIDVSALSSWLAVRAIDRETRRLDALERGEIVPSPPANPLAASPPVVGPGPAAPIEPRHIAPRPKPVAPAPPPPATPPQVSSTPSIEVPPLPPPIDIRPPPGQPRSRARPPLPLIPVPN